MEVRGAVDQDQVVPARGLPDDVPQARLQLARRTVRQRVVELAGVPAARDQVDAARGPSGG